MTKGRDEASIWRGGRNDNLADLRSFLSQPEIQTFSRPCGTWFLCQTYPALRAGLLSAVRLRRTFTVPLLWTVIDPWKRGCRRRGLIHRQKPEREGQEATMD
jgi:hypothetical protein